MKLNHKKIANFLLGGIMLAVSAGCLISLGLQNYIIELDKEMLRRTQQSPIRESLLAAFKLYIIIYILFSTLPDKIKKATWGKKAIYFTLFYIFCVTIYMFL